MRYVILKTANRSAVSALEDLEKLVCADKGKPIGGPSITCKDGVYIAYQAVLRK